MPAAGCVGGRIAELGTGVGVGTAWMASTMPSDCLLVTVLDLVGMLRLGGRIVNDDITPQLALPPDSPFLADDPKRQAFFADPRLVSAEVGLPGLRNSLLVGTRVS